MSIANVSLEDKYRLERGTVFLTGMQALARLPMLQHELDRRAGLHTAGYVSGYRGSPLGGLDFALPQDGVNIRWPDPPLAQERRMQEFKVYAATVSYTHLTLPTNREV